MGVIYVKHKKVVSSLILLIVACLIGVFFFKDFFITPTSGDHRNITDLESAYNADTEIAQALARMKSSQEKAPVIAHSKSSQRQIALTFDGLTDRTTVQQILDLLEKYNAKATFFIDGMQTAEDPQAVVNIKKAGHQIENYTLAGMVKMETLPVERLVKDFCRAQKIIKVTTDQGPNLLKCNNTKYTDPLLQAAKACGFNGVVKSDVFVNARQINSFQAADDFVSKLSPGSIVSIKLKANVEPIINESGKTDLRPAIDKQPGLKALPQPAETGEKEIVAAVEKLLIALNKANYATVYVENFATNKIISPTIKTSVLPNASAFLVNAASFLREQVVALFSFRSAYAAELVDHQAQEIKVISTTEPAFSYTFGGLANETVVNDVLGRLHGLGIKATFFVMEIEMQRYPGALRKIIQNGHEIGLAIRPKEGETFGETRFNIMHGRKMLQERFGVATNLVKQPWGAVADTTKEAVASLGCKLIGQSVNVVQSKHRDYTSADQIMPEIFGKYTFSLARGQIIHFRMDYYTNDWLVGDLLETIKQRKVDNIAYVTSYDNPANNLLNDSQYTIKPVGKILANTNFIYQYPANPVNVPVDLRYDGPRLEIDKHNFMDEAAKRYIGHEYVNDEDRMIGFSKMETRRLDTSGLIHTEDNVVFLTFDDWGSDAAINKILYVLRKHHVTGTFFIITHNVLNNPNLLRAIAMDGHEIASHSNMHKPMAVRDPRTGTQVKTQDKEEYLEDLATSYQRLRDVTGDVIVNGKPALTRFFRPPTLAVSKMGFEALFATGYEYIISGSVSTSDYGAKNVPQLLKTIKDGVYTTNGGVKKGAILVMHMGDTAVYTAMALDILLTANEAKADSDPSKFKVGRLSDYLTEGYSQINRKQSLKLNSHDKGQ
jgi:peptidoglycan/xylan/chitin deacetylase (PgdA/CDA1 family)